MPAPGVSRTVRLSLGLYARVERVRERTEARAGVGVDLRAVVERAVADGLEAAERRLALEESGEHAAA